MKQLKEDSKSYQKLTDFNIAMEQFGIEVIHAYHGLIYHLVDENKYYKYCIEDKYESQFCLPPSIEGCYILCDENGNNC